MCVFCSNTISAQENLIFDNSRHKIGFVSGYGNQSMLNVLYDYRVCFFQFQYYYSLLGKQTWDLEILAQPQYNITKYKYKDYFTDDLDGYEVGLNIGILIRGNLVKKYLSFYGLLSSGPHYVSGVPRRQANGFIFSDNISIGMNVRLIKSLYLDVRSGIRHISNAKLKSPNGGVNNFIINIGVFTTL